MALRGGRGLLSFVGLGLHDERGITVAGLDEVAKADIVFAEEYTSMLSKGSLQKLEGIAAKSIQHVDRSQVEDGRVILAAAAEQRVALLVAGDPMTATTHVDLRLRAERAGIMTRVVHGSSALTAVPGILGLQHYKFGRTTTVPFPSEKFLPTSPCEVISENFARGLHTLVLLDIDADDRRYMTANEGMRTLLKMEARVKNGVINDDTIICVVSRAGAPDCVAKAGRLSALVNENFGPPMHTIVVPGQLHFMEREALEMLAGLR